MSIPAKSIESLAKAITQSRLLGTRLKESFADNIHEAYQILDRIIETKEPGFGKQVGWKLGATNQGALSSLQLDKAFFGPLFENFIYSPDAVVELAQLGIFRAAEAEFCIILKGDLLSKMDGSEHTLAEVSAQIGGVAPAIELAATRYECPITAPIAISDLALNGMCCIGDKILLPPAADGLSSCEASLEIDGVEVSACTTLILIYVCSYLVTNR